MLKATIFTLGLTSGIFVGIYLREKGVTSGLTRSYHAYHNLDYGKKKPIKEKRTIDDLFDFYRAGLLEGEDLEKFEEIIRSKRYDKIDELVLNDVDKLFEKDLDLKMIKERYQARNNI